MRLADDEVGAAAGAAEDVEVVAFWVRKACDVDEGAALPVVTAGAGHDGDHGVGEGDHADLEGVDGVEEGLTCGDDEWSGREAAWLGVLPPELAEPPAEPVAVAAVGSGPGFPVESPEGLVGEVLLEGVLASAAALTVGLAEVLAPSEEAADADGSAAELELSAARAVSDGLTEELVDVVGASSAWAARGRASTPSPVRPRTPSACARRARAAVVGGCRCREGMARFPSRPQRRPAPLGHHGQVAPGHGARTVRIGEPQRWSREDHGRP